MGHVFRSSTNFIVIVVFALLFLSHWTTSAEQHEGDAEETASWPTQSRQPYQMPASIARVTGKGKLPFLPRPIELLATSIGFCFMADLELPFSERTNGIAK